MAEPPSPDVTRILSAIDEGDRKAADELLPIVYEELRRLAAAKMSNEPLGHTLQPTALVHEAYLRLVGGADSDSAHWESRGHFYAAAAEAMRRILIERARKYHRPKHGGNLERVPLEDPVGTADADPGEMLALDGAMARLADQDRRLYDVALLRFFSGLPLDQIAELLGVSLSTVNREWRCARIWLCEQMNAQEDQQD